MNNPFLKWAGSKRQSIQYLQEYIGDVKGTFIEPFVGSGTVFLNIKADNYLLADLNKDLITLYNILKESGVDFVAFCKTLFTKANNNELTYYELRDVFNTTEDDYYKAALFVYLNRHAFNGLCRYNTSGGFNVPYGKYLVIQQRISKRIIRSFVVTSRFFPLISSNKYKLS